MVVTKSAHPAARPAIVFPCPFARAVEDGGNRQIRHLTGQNPNEIEDIAFDRPAGLSDLVLLHDKTCVIVALPMDDEC